MGQAGRPRAADRPIATRGSFRSVEDRGALKRIAAIVFACLAGIGYGRPADSQPNAPVKAKLVKVAAVRLAFASVGLPVVVWFDAFKPITQQPRVPLRIVFPNIDSLGGPITLVPAQHPWPFIILMYHGRNDATGRLAALHAAEARNDPTIGLSLRRSVFLLRGNAIVQYDPRLPKRIVDLIRRATSQL